MIEELHVFGVFIPAALAWAVAAGAAAYLVRNLLRRLPIYNLLWHPSLLELGLFAVLWWLFTVLSDAFMPRWVIS